MARYKFTIEYDGSEFSGWQIQPNAVTVEETLEQAFSVVLQQEIDLLGQGRTDAGVHAEGQVAHADLPDGTDIPKLIHRVNSMVGDAVALTGFEQADDNFHSRFDATGREYQYQVVTRKHPLLLPYSWYVFGDVDHDKLSECAAMVSGIHDFGSFCKKNEEQNGTECELLHSEWIFPGDRLLYIVRANRFLRNMVRRLAGTMIRVGEGKTSMQEFRQMIEKPGPEHATHTAPARGLILKKVFY